MTGTTSWGARVSDRSDPALRVALPDLPPPTRLLTTSGVGQVTLDWDLVPGAVGYLVHRAPSPDGPFAVVDHHGMDVLAVPEPPYVDTSGTLGERAWYAVSAIPEVTRTGPLSEAVEGTPRRAGVTTPVVDVCVDASSEGRPVARPWEPMIGSERLSHLLVTDTTGGRPIGAELLAALDRHGFPDARILWTEWGVIPTHFAPVNDSVFAASFLLIGMRSAAGRVEALSSWVASDHFEELGRPPRLIHGGFGLRSVGDLPKPRSHALALLARLGRTELPSGVAADGAGSLVQSWAGRDGDRVAALIWTGTLDQTKADAAGRVAAGAEALARRVRLAIDGLEDGPVEIVVTRLAPGEGDLAAAAAALHVGDWPEDDATWAALAEGAAMPVETSRADVVRGRLEVQLDLPLPAAALVEVRPA